MEWEKPTQILTVCVAPGTYLITARLRVLSQGWSNAEKLAADCILSTGDVVHLNHLNTNQGERTERIGWPVVLHDVATFDRSTVIAVLGTTTHEAGWLAEQVIITALRIGAINPPTLLGFIPFRPPEGAQVHTATDPDAIAGGSRDSEMQELRSELQHVTEALEASRRETEALRERLEPGVENREDHP